jgi:transposase-like protein
MVVVANLVLGANKGIRIEAAQYWPEESEANGYGGNKKCKKRWRTRDLEKRGADWGGRSKSWWVPLLRSLMLWGLWQTSGQVGPDWLQLLPWLIWLLPENQNPWGGIRQRLWDVQRIVLLGYTGLSVYHLFEQLNAQTVWGVGLLGCAVCGDEPRVEVRQTEEGEWQAEISGHFRLQVRADHPFRLRLLLIFLGLLQSENDERHSRRTRDGRTPFVRQEQLANWTHTKQEHISLWMKAWLKGDWANLLSLKTAEVLTSELTERIVTVLATFPDWTGEQVRDYLLQQGCKVSRDQIEQASQVSGWKRLSATLRERYDLKAGMRLRDEWLVSQLLSQTQNLLTKVETLGGLPREERIPLADVETLAVQSGAVATPTLPVQPWLQAMESTLLGSWEPVADAAIRCIYCGSSDVAPKSKKPRPKKFYNAHGKVQEVEVVRYYCHNSLCAKQTFTHFPPGLLPYSPYRTQVHLLAMQMYAWGYSTYRRSGTALGVYAMTAYRWVSAWGHDLLPIAALFGVVRSSGVVGVDEKYVLVPKNDKPEGKMRRWMYVYLAVDAWTYDLLHIAIYPHNTDDSATAFLLALRAKGYHPTVIVTDLRQDYGPVIAQVFPAAQHHECIFHALQNIQKHIKDAYGSDYSQTHPEALLLKQQIYAIFDTSSQAEAQVRYLEVLTLKLPYLTAAPAALPIFDFLERHWPKLVNAIGSETIPTTNNTTELVIRRFDQHYQNFCGFQSIETAHTYLAVFEKLYRFTPFSQDAQPRIRGKSPLQLAGYDISLLPLSSICSGLSVDWPTEVNLVPG